MRKSIFNRVTMASLMLAGFASPSFAQDDGGLARKFGARESIRDISLSPTGNKVVAVIPGATGGENAVVLDIAAGGTIVPILSSTGGTEKITNCQFVVDTRVVCGLYLTEGTGTNIDAATRLATVASDGTDLKGLSARATTNAYVQSNYGGDIVDYDVPGDGGAVLMTRYFPPEMRTGSLVGNSTAGLGVERVDVTSLERKLVERPRDGVFDYLSDGHGEIRIMATQDTTADGYAKRKLNYSYRPKGGSGWKPLSTVTFDSGLSTGFSPVAVDSALDVAYGFMDLNGHLALFARTLDGNGTDRLVLARPDADVDALVRIGRNQRVVGASYATDRRLVEYFDKELNGLATALSKALPNALQISIVDSNADESKIVIFAGSDSDPGTYYLYDKKTKQLGSMFPTRPELAGIKLAEMKPIRFPASDGTMVPGYLTLPVGSNGQGIPAIVMPHGGPSSRDELGFDWLVQYFAARGFAVLQPNYRGSSGLGSAWFQKNGFQSWQTAIGDVNDAGRWLVKEGIAPAGKLAIFGWSYGGYAALQSPVLDPDLFKAIVAVAPVTDLDLIREEARNYANYYVVDNYVGNGPHVAAGSPARHANVFKAPVLIFHGDRDQNVAVGESRLMEKRLKDAGKQVEYIEFPGLAHQLDSTDARSRMLSTSDQFLRKALGIK